uniref:Uncharacterized protein n=1 Tax=Glossina brevipalpis TaxID=37001 RepID=A0A1A9X2L1_9MUSC
MEAVEDLTKEFVQTATRSSPPALLLGAVTLETLRQLLTTEAKKGRIKLMLNTGLIEIPVMGYESDVITVITIITISVNLMMDNQQCAFQEKSTKLKPLMPRAPLAVGIACMTAVVLANGIRKLKIGLHLILVMTYCVTLTVVVTVVVLHFKKSFNTLPVCQFPFVQHLLSMSHLIQFPKNLKCLFECTVEQKFK